jgi:uncharacterized protein
MRSILMSLHVTALLLAQTGGGAAGHWEGSIEIPGTPLPILCDLSRGENGTWEGKLSIPAQNLRDFKLGSVVVDGPNVSFVMPGIPGDPTFKGKLAADSTAIAGEFTQGGRTLPFKLEHKTGTIAEPKRPQEPKPPYPYREEEVAFDSREAGVKLAGTLTLPGKTPAPAVVLIAGSGPNDRNESVFGHKPFLVLADYLTRRGVAVLRYDKRGIGKSTGNLATATTVDFTKDALGAVEFLKGRKDIDAKRIGLMGHSEGGWIAPMAANQSTSVAFVVLLAGSAVTGEKLLLSQAGLVMKAMGATDEAVQVNHRIQQIMFDAIKAEKDDAAAEKRMEEGLKPVLAAQPENVRAMQQKALAGEIKRVLAPWFRFMVTYDPYPALTRLKCPVLAIGGEKDLQVAPKENLPLIEKALKEGGNKDFQVVEMPGLNHLLQAAKSGSIIEYAQIEETINPAALDLIGGWIGKHTK